MATWMALGKILGRDAHSINLHAECAVSRLSIVDLRVQASTTCGQRTSITWSEGNLTPVGRLMWRIMVYALPNGVQAQEGRKYYICSSRLGLIRWYDRFRSDRRIQQVKAILDKVRYTDDILLPHELLHGASAIHI